MRPISFLLAALVLLGCGGTVDKTAVDLILTDADIYTVNPAQPWARAMAVDEGRIVAIGDEEEILAQFEARRHLTLDGAMVLPGFHDTHLHPAFAGIQLGQCNLAELLSVPAILDGVRACDAALPPGAWLLGGGWNLGLFEAANPHKSLLDEINDQRPMLLIGDDGHSAWVNSAALAVAGVSRETPNPDKGIIERDPVTGEPSGTLRETAQELVRAVAPVTSAEERAAATARALDVLRSVGITSIIDASASGDEVEAYRTLESSGALGMKVVISVPVVGGNTVAADLALIDPADRGSGRRIRVDAAKIYVDGVLEGETAALLEPYSGGGQGELNIEPAELAGLVTRLDARNVQVHMHAIGDAAVRAGLDAIEAARRSNGSRDNRHHISHLQLIDENDLPRFGELAVLANFQAAWAFPEEYITDVNLPAVGAERVQRMYPIGSIERAGGTLVAGSDWPVSSPNPLVAIEVALTRTDPTGRLEGVLNASEAVSLESMLRAYTATGAYLMHQEHETGSLEPGKLADIVVLERNLFEIDAADIGEVAVLMTFFEGEAVYSAPAP